MALLDTVWTYKFIKIISTKWVDQPAYGLGIIDEKGTILKRQSTLKTDEEKSAYTMFHRLVWNVKRTIERLPGGDSKLKRYGSALFLIKEEAIKMGFSEEKATLFESALNEHLNEEPTNTIGNAGEGDIDTFDPLLKKKKMARRKKKVGAKDLEDEKNETPARTNEGKVAEWIAFYNKVPKSKEGLLAIAPAYNESVTFEASVLDAIQEAMKRRKKRNAHGRVEKFYKRTGDCPPGKTKNRKGGCEKMKGNRSLAQVKKTKRISAKKKKRTEKKFSANSSHWKQATRLRKRTSRA